MAIFNSFLYVYQRVVVQPSQESRSMIQDPLSCRFIIPCWNLQRCWYSQKKCQTMGYTPYKYGVYCILHINMDIFPCFIYLYPYLYPYTPYIYIWYPRVLTTRVFSKQKPDRSIFIGAERHLDLSPGHPASSVNGLISHRKSSQETMDSASYIT